jgi:D-alanyl-D-alanine dipeptidase
MHDANAPAGRGLAGFAGIGEADSLPLAPGLLSGSEAQRRAASPETPVLLSDPVVSAVPVRDCGEPLTALGESFGPSRALVRASVAQRLVLARDDLPRGVGLWVVAGYRTAAAQRAIIGSYAAGLRRAHPAIGAAELGRLTSRFVAPLAVAPHVAGAAADLTLVDSAGRELDLGTPVDATPEQSEGACYFDAPKVGRQARANRELLARALRGAGLVNYPTEWWHWSYGDRYWALVTGAPAALYGPVTAERAAR